MNYELLAIIGYFVVIGLIFLSDSAIYKKKFEDMFRRK